MGDLDKYFGSYSCPIFITNPGADISLTLDAIRPILRMTAPEMVSLHSSIVTSVVMSTALSPARSCASTLGLLFFLWQIGSGYSRQTSLKYPNKPIGACQSLAWAVTATSLHMYCLPKVRPMADMAMAPEG